MSVVREYIISRVWDWVVIDSLPYTPSSPQSPTCTSRSSSLVLRSATSSLACASSPRRRCDWLASLSCASNDSLSWGLRARVQGWVRRVYVSAYRREGG